MHINKLSIEKRNASILFTSAYNFNQDIVDFIYEDCIVIEKNATSNVNDINSKILNEFNLQSLLTKNEYTKIDEIKIHILANLQSSKEIFVFFNVLTYLDQHFKKQVFNYLMKQNKIIINYTSDIEEVLLLNYLYVIHNDSIIMEGETKEILKEEKILNKLGFKPPFIVELSQGLKYYGLIDKIYYNEQELVEDIWK